MKFTECFDEIVFTISKFVHPIKQLQFLECGFDEVELANEIFIKLCDESNWFRHDAGIEIEISTEFKIYVTANFHWNAQKVTLFFYRKTNFEE